MISSNPGCIPTFASKSMCYRKLCEHLREVRTPMFEKLQKIRCRSASAETARGVHNIHIYQVLNSVLVQDA